MSRTSRRLEAHVLILTRLLLVSTSWTQGRRLVHHRQLILHIRGCRGSALSRLTAAHVVLLAVLLLLLLCHVTFLVFRLRKCLLYLRLLLWRLARRVASPLHVALGCGWQEVLFLGAHAAVRIRDRL